MDRPTLDDFRSELPDALIAQRPAERRSASRLMVIDRAAGHWTHHGFEELPQLLQPGDLLVANDTRVVPARVWTRKSTGGRVELLFHGDPEESPDGTWRCRGLTRSSKRLKPGTVLTTDRGSATVTLAEVHPGGEATVAGDGEGFHAFLDRCGELPLPPYITRGDAGPDGQDASRYQTVFAREPGAVAAPTAGLHFTDEIFARLGERGVDRATVTLHVGPGTFMPIRVDDYTKHTMHGERFSVSPETAGAVEAATQADDRRVVAVGTTSVRTLEWVARDDGRVRPGAGETRLYCTPGFDFRVVDALVTNFHLPGSTLLLLVAAFAGTELILDAYRDAVREGYRFYSYGDAMLIV